MSRSIFSWNWQDRDGQPLGTARERDLLRSKQQALRVLPGLTFVFAGLYLAMAVATVIKGQFRPAWMLAAIPALAAAYLAVRGLRRHSIGLCAAAGFGVLCAWGALSALSALVTQGLN